MSKSVIFSVFSPGKTQEISFTRKGDKQGGANSSGQHGGIYEYQEEGASRRILLKTDSREKDMAEFIAGQVFAATVPDYAAKVVIVKTDEGPYIGSKFIDGYKDLFHTVRTSGLKKDGRNFMAGTVNKITGFMEKALLKEDGTERYTGFAQVMAPSLLVGDFDVHTGNVGLQNNQNLVRIDYAAAFERLEGEIHPHSQSRHLPGLGPTNHFREYPRTLRISESFSKESQRIAAVDLRDVVHNALDALNAAGYTTEDFQKFAVRLGLKKGDLPKEQGQLIEHIDVAMSSLLKKRQQSLKEFGIEIAIDLCFDKKGEFKEQGREKLEELIENNLDYFRAIKSGDKALHFRDKDHQKTAAQSLMTRLIDNSINSAFIAITKKSISERQPTRTVTVQSESIVATESSKIQLPEPSAKIDLMKPEAPAATSTIETVSVVTRLNEIPKPEVSQTVITSNPDAIVREQQSATVAPLKQETILPAQSFEPVLSATKGSVQKKTVTQTVQTQVEKIRQRLAKALGTKNTLAESAVRKERTTQTTEVGKQGFVSKMRNMFENKIRRQGEKMLSSIKNIKAKKQDKGNSLG